MCPVSEEYIQNVYKKDRKPIKVDGKLEKELIQKAKKVLVLSRKNPKVGLIFPDVFAIEKQLLQKNKIV